jgi:SAM-dependent methyltransferase
MSVGLRRAPLQRRPVRAQSALRKAQDAEWAKLSLDGQILDIGGARQNRYHQFIGGDHQITFGNISEAYEPDLIFSAEEEWPVEPGAYDAVLMNNLLEHVYRPQACIAGAFKALRSGGQLIGSTPFLFRVHPGPRDYWRFTDEALARMFEDAGFSSSDIRPMGTGGFSAGWELSAMPLIHLAPIWWAGQALSGAIDGLANAIRPKSNIGPGAAPLGYFWIARKG